jgi:hypothetical protein
MSTYPSTIIFAINENNAAPFRSFLNWLGFTAVRCNGASHTPEETCYIMNEKDFEQHVLYSGWVRDQASVLHVTGCNKMYATLRFLDRDTGLYSGTRRGLGSMQQVSEEVARSYPSWMHNMHNNAWYITAHRNPDHSNEILPYNTRPARDYYVDDMVLKHGDVIECVALIGSLCSYTVGKQYRVDKAAAPSPTRVVNDHGVAQCTSARFKYVTGGRDLCKFDINEEVSFHCILDVGESMVVAAAEEYGVAVWWAANAAHSVHLSPDNARAMGERLIAIADKLEKTYG